MTRSLPEQDLIRLNAYLDGELSRRGRAAVEARLAESAALREEMQALREVKALLGMAERVPVPRNFTLDPKIYGKPTGAGLWGRLRLSSLSTLATVGAMALATVICGGIVWSQFGLGGLSRQMAEVAADSALSGAPEAAPQGAAVMATQGVEPDDGWPVEATTTATPVAELTTLPESGGLPPRPVDGLGGGPSGDIGDSASADQPGLAMPLPSPTVAEAVEGAAESLGMGNRGPAEKTGAAAQPSEPLAAEVGATSTLSPRHERQPGIGARTLWIVGGIAAFLVAGGLLALVVLRLRRS